MLGPIKRNALVLVTSQELSASELVDCVSAAAQNGVDMVQLRRKRASARELVELGSRLLELVHKAGARLIVNERVDVALAIGADGVHLPEEAMAASDARELLGADALIGRSVHSIDSIRSPLSRSANWVQFGPVFATASKPGASGRGLDELGEAAQAATSLGLGLCAVGGLDAERAASAIAAGAGGVAVVRAICADPSYANASAQLRAALDKG